MSDPVQTPPVEAITHVGKTLPPGAQIRQIATTSNSYGNGGVVESVTVLLSDNTIWRYPMVGAEEAHREWVQIPTSSPATFSAEE